MIKKFLLKIAFLVIVFNLPLLGVTNALLSDTESSLTNKMVADILDLTLRSGQNNFVPADKAGNMKPGDSVARDIYVGKTSVSVNLKHDVSYEYVSGNSDFCQQLQLKVWYDHYHCDPAGGYAACRDMRLKYNGSLAALAGVRDDDFIIFHPDDFFDTDSSNGTEQWFYYSISLPVGTDPLLQNQVCQFNLKFKSWQEDSDGSWGFVDQEVLSGNQIATGDWTAPYVKIESPGEGALISGVVDIYGTVTDNAPDHYWLVAEKKSNGQMVTGFPGVVHEENSFTNRLLYQWDTSQVEDGEYIIKLEARDQAGNKDPNLAPVPADPENPNDSVDWITVVVDNTAPQAPLLISPGSGVKIRADKLYLDWSDVADPHGPVKYEYRLYLESPDSNPAAPIRYQKDYYEPISRHPASGFATGTPEDDYWWRVRACDSLNNCSSWTPAWHFVVDNSLPDSSADGTEPPASSIVLNEILPDPLGGDTAAKPDGEWVELYNKSSSLVSLAGWKLSDADSHFVTIIGSRTNTGGTDIAPHGFLVIYVGPTALTLNNSGDTVNLYDDSSNLIDSHTYPDTPVGKSIARIPDGGDTWYDPIPTPGGPNRLEINVFCPVVDGLNGGEAFGCNLVPSLTPTPTSIPAPEIKFYFEAGQKAVGFKASNISQFNQLKYEISYQSGKGPQGIMGTVEIDGENEINRDNFILGTCSTGGTCVYHTGVKAVRLEVKLKGAGGEKMIVKKITL